MEENIERNGDPISPLRPGLRSYFYARNGRKLSERRKHDAGTV